ncbi:MerR family transcriptional regulator [Aestuariicoccus sp. MJ-SS9]|uniref:MerR family transcriptional regulator n=1 Tax=Aestuariicoccus sp. MJ-SS9 TaxID=3079855 RepID=UPI0029135264|nr:MerR family transcriptional regulator [Aestuariicoccus sp. MJ-SS9]MDU8912494.1 MerR family transcriptional regulator [Aestuariicoccus sp. MJ-SS9]
MLGHTSIDEVRDWTGDAEALAHKTTFWARRLGVEDTSDVTVRLIRDYAQRHILERPRREGKVAIYGWDHLVRLLAARKLLSEGWPLQKIAEFFLVSSIEEIRALLPGSPTPRATSAEDPALSDLRRMQDRASTRPTAPQMVSAERAFSRMRGDSEARNALTSLRDTLGLEQGKLRSQQMTRIEIAPGVELTIETRRLKNIGAREAEAIAHAVSACLTDPRIRAKGEDTND